MKNFASKSLPILLYFFFCFFLFYLIEDIAKEDMSNKTVLGACSLPFLINTIFNYRIDPLSFVSIRSVKREWGFYSVGFESDNNSL